MEKGAIISECGKYRYQLWRIWDVSKPMCMFVMHNPSTADANDDDPTIRRCIGFAKSWGYGGIYVGNLTPYRATNPKSLIDLSLYDLFPKENYKHLVDMFYRSYLHVLAYGNPVVPWPKNQIPFKHKNWHCLKITKKGNPFHPLYLKKDLKLTPFNCSQ